MNKDKGIVIFGHPRSGTTLLRRLLDAHSAIASPPETHLFGACARFLDKDYTADGLDMGVLSGLHFAGVDNNLVIEQLRKFAFHFLEDYASNQGKRRWAEKTAFDIFNLNAIEELCSDKVFYLGIIRHPLDVAVSCKEFCDAAGVYPKEMHRYIKRFSQPITAFVNSWVDTTNSLIELGKRRPESCLILRYEDLVQAPEEILTEVIQAIGEEMQDNLIEMALKNTETLGLSDHKSYQESSVHEKSIGKWNSIPLPQVKELAPLINPLLDILGYDLIEIDSNFNIEDSRNRYINSLAVNASKKK